MGVSEFFFVEDMQLVGEWLVVQAAWACSPLLDFYLCFEVVQCGGVSPWGMGVKYIFYDKVGRRSLVHPCVAFFGDFLWSALSLSKNNMFHYPYV